MEVARFVNKNINPMSPIKEIHSAVVAIPLSRPVAWSNVTISVREYILCWVVDDEGRTGFAYGMGSRFPMGAHLMHHVIQDNLKPVVLNQDPFMSEAIWDAMYRRTFLIGRQGAVMRAISCIDIAIWDLKAKIVGLPLFKFLGGFQNKVKAYASGGYYEEGKGPSGLAKEIEMYRARGFDSFKIKTGQLSPELEEERVAAARQAAGTGKLAIDANNAWRSMAEAWPYLRRIEKYDPWWIEEPFSPDDRAAYGELAKHTSIPIASGELESGRETFRNYVETGSAHILQADATVVGGITEWRRVAAMAACWNLPVAPHWIPDIHAHLLASVSNGWPVEYFLPEADILNFDKLVQKPLHVQDGWIHLSDEPGHGVRLDPDKVKSYLQTGTAPKQY
jgi:D-arabinonate dehydratase